MPPIITRRHAASELTCRRPATRFSARNAPCPTHRWRGGRVAEGGGLLNRYTANPVSWVRIPSPPPTSLLGPSFLAVGPQNPRSARLSEPPTEPETVGQNRVIRGQPGINPSRQFGGSEWGRPGLKRTRAAASGPTPDRLYHWSNHRRVPHVCVRRIRHRLWQVID